MDPPMAGNPNMYAQQRRPAQKRHGKAASSRANQGFAGSTPLFEDTSTEPPMNPGANAGVPPGMMQFPMADVMQSPVTNVALQYGSNMANQGKEYVEKNIDRFVSVSKLKYYFAVDTSYVVKKLGLLVLPYTHKNWSVQYNKSEPVPPRYEINAPDLYIPVMAFVTYVLVAGLVLGTQNRFTPEQFGITASSALVWLFVEIMVILFSMYICNVQAEIKYLDLLAFCGYKYFGMILACLGGLLFNTSGYYAVLAWMSLSTAFFLVRTLRLIISPEAAADGVGRASKRRLYLLLSIAALQPFFMYFLTSHLKPQTADFADPMGTA